MSLYFNWSCDFQRFTKSKKLSKFQVRTTTLFILNKSLSTSLFNLQGTICCDKHFIELFQALNRSSNSLFSISKLEPFVKNFFRFIFQTRSRSHDKLFSFAPPSRDSFNRIPNLNAFVKYFFQIFEKTFPKQKRRLTPPFSLFRDARTKPVRRGPEPCPAT